MAALLLLLLLPADVEFATVADEMGTAAADTRL